MSKPLHIDARWSPRTENAAELAVRLARFLEGLAALHSALARWNKLGNTRKEANAPFCSMPPRLEELTKICAKARERDESVDAWNGIEGALASNFSVRGGEDYPYLVYHPFPNHAEVKLPGPSLDNADLVNFPVAMSVLRTMVTAWEPDFAAVQTFAYRNELPGDWPGTQAGWLPIYGAWLTYLCPTFARQISPPSEVQTEKTANGGLFMIAVPELFDPENPAHEAAVRAVHTALGPLLDKIRTEFSPPPPHG